MESRRHRALQWIAGIVTAVLAVLVVVGLAASRTAKQDSFAPASNVATPTPAATATAVADYGPPPPEVNLIYVHDPNHPTWLIGFDWSGTPRATVKLDPTPSAVVMAPDGQTFALGLYAKGGAWQFLDRTGRLIGPETTLAGAINPLWADDNKHVCSIAFDSQTLEWTLWTQLPGEAAKRVRVVATDSVIGQSGVSLVACSFKNDTVIAVRTVQAWPSEYWVIRLSDGTVLADDKGGGSDIASIVGSRDASLVAFNSSKSSGQSGTVAPTTQISRASDSGLVASLDPSFGVLGFNGDDSRALVTLTPWVGGQPAHLGMVDLQTGNLVWQDEGSALFGGFIVQPGGQDFVISYPTTAQGPGPATILIVQPGGGVIKLPGVYAPTW